MRANDTDNDTTTETDRRPVDRTVPQMDIENQSDRDYSDADWPFASRPNSTTYIERRYCRRVAVPPSQTSGSHHRSTYQLRRARVADNVIKATRTRGMLYPVVNRNSAVPTRTRIRVLKMYISHGLPYVGKSNWAGPEAVQTVGTPTFVRNVVFTGPDKGRRIVSGIHSNPIASDVPRDTRSARTDVSEILVGKNTCSRLIKKYIPDHSHDGSWQVENRETRRTKLQSATNKGLVFLY